MGWKSKEYLKCCQELREAGVLPSFRPGERLARGFADLGFEEFLLLPGSKLVSLINGKSAELVESHQHFFFRVFSCDDLANEINKRGFELLSVIFMDQRTWHITVSKPGDEALFEVQAGMLDQALAQALLVISR